MASLEESDLKELIQGQQRQLIKIIDYETYFLSSRKTTRPRSDP